MVFYLFRHLIFSRRAGALVRRIALLSLVAISVSVTAFLLVIFVMNGMNESIQNRIIALEPHLILQKSNQAPAEWILEQDPSFQSLKENKNFSLEEFENQDVILRTMDGQFRGAVARGISARSLTRFISRLNEVDQGNRNREDDISSWVPAEVPGSGEIALGLDLARGLNVFEGDYLTIVPPEGLILPPGEAPPFERVKVKKIFSTSLADIDSQFIFYQKGQALKNFSKAASRHFGYELWLDRGYDASGIKKRILSEWSPQNLKNVQVETWIDRNSALFYALKMEKLIIGIFLGLAGLIASTSILTVLALLMSQKKRDIALLRTLGLSGRQTVKLFTQIGMWLAGTGVGVGLILGIGLGLYVQYNPVQILPQIYTDSQIPARVEIWLVVLVALISAAVGFLGSWLPARTANEIEPSMALRLKN